MAWTYTDSTVTFQLCTEMISDENILITFEREGEELTFEATSVDLDTGIISLDLSQEETGDMSGRWEVQLNGFKDGKRWASDKCSVNFKDNLLDKVIGGEDVPKVIEITANGTYTEDVKGFKTAEITVNVPNPSTGVLEIVENGTYDVTEFASVEVAVPSPQLDTIPFFTIEESGRYQYGSDKGSFTAPIQLDVNVPSDGDGEGGGEPELFLTQTKTLSVAGETLSATFDSERYRDDMLFLIVCEMNVTGKGGFPDSGILRFSAVLSGAELSNNQINTAMSFSCDPAFTYMQSLFSQSPLWNGWNISFRLDTNFIDIENNEITLNLYSAEYLMPDV